MVGFLISSVFIVKLITYFFETGISFDNGIPVLYVAVVGDTVFTWKSIL